MIKRKKTKITKIKQWNCPQRNFCVAKWGDDGVETLATLWKEKVFWNLIKQLKISNCISYLNIPYGFYIVFSNFFIQKFDVRWFIAFLNLTREIFIFAL